MSIANRILRLTRRRHKRLMPVLSTKGICFFTRYNERSSLFFLGLPRRRRRDDVRQPPQLRPETRRSQFQIPLRRNVIDITHVCGENRQELFNVVSFLVPAGYGMDSKRVAQVLKARLKSTISAGDAREGP